MQDGKPETAAEAFDFAHRRAEEVKGLRRVASLREREDFEALAERLRAEAAEVWPPARGIQGEASGRVVRVSLTAVAFAEVRARPGGSYMPGREAILIQTTTQDGGGSSGVEIPVAMVRDLRRELRRMLDDLDERGWLDD